MYGLSGPIFQVSRSIHNDDSKAWWVGGFIRDKSIFNEAIFTQCLFTQFIFNQRFFESGVSNREVLVGDTMILKVVRWPHWFGFFKWSIYLALSSNIGFFFLDEWEASHHLLRDGATPLLLLESFAATIDTAAWVVLLLMFELVTYQIDDAKLTPALKRTLVFVRSVCFALILTAFAGYILKLISLLSASPMLAQDICQLGAMGYQQMTNLDEYTAITNTACLASTDSYLINQSDLWIIATNDVNTVMALASADVGNSVCWIFVVVLLELEVQLGVGGRRAARLPGPGNAIKMSLYGLLVGFAVYWGFEGSFLDFWDAFLWILAFVFIERNVIVWKKEYDEVLPQEGIT